MTGYARFLNDETPGCDDMSLGVWCGGPKLSRDVRGRLNRLVLAADDKLRGTVDAVDGRFRGSARPRVLFVDYDGMLASHRFRELGVVEPAYSWTDTWFVLVGGPDNARNETSWPSGTNGDPDGTRYPGLRAVLSPLSPLLGPETCLSDAQ